MRRGGGAAAGVVASTFPLSSDRRSFNPRMAARGDRGACGLGAVRARADAGAALSRDASGKPRDRRARRAPSNRHPPLPAHQAPGARSPPAHRPQGAGCRGEFRQTEPRVGARGAARGRALRARDRSGVQRLLVFPHRLPDRALDRALALPRAARLPRLGGHRWNRARRDRGVRHEPPLEHGLHPRRVSRRGPGGALLRRGRVGPHLAALGAGARHGRVFRAPRLQGRALPARARALHRDGDRGGRSAGGLPRGRPHARGRMREPRLGVIDYMMRGFRLDGEHDLVFVPLGINYDRVLEDRSLLRALDPNAPRVGRARVLWNTLVFAAHNLRLMLKSGWHRFGYACVNFGSPISMRAYCRDRGVDFQKLSGEARRRETAALGAHLMEAVGRVVPVVPVPLMATVFVGNPERRLSALELKAEVGRLLEGLERAGARVYVPRRDFDYALDVGLRMLLMRHLVDEHDGLYLARENELPLLRYYANSIAHLLAQSSILKPLSKGGEP